MKYYGLIKDDIYPISVTNSKRLTVRAILVNSNKKIGMLRIRGKDIFGDRNHLETPGGGVNDYEDNISALKREIKEEVGFSIKNIKLIGKIDIQYNLLNRIDEGIFYYCECDEYLGSSLEEYEKEIIQNIEWYDYFELLKLYEDNNEVNVAKMIYQRDYLMLKNAKEFGYFD